MRTNLILFLLTLTLSLLAAEGILHVLDVKESHPPKPEAWVMLPEQTWVEHDPDLGWAHQKNKKAVLERKNEKIVVTTNSLGVRGKKEYSVEKPAEKFRILAFGDSFTFGFGVQDDETFPAQLEAMDPQLEVWNRGVPAYGVDQIYLALKTQTLPYQPDLVIATLFPEDFWRALRAFNDGGYGKPYFVQADRGLELRHVPVPRGKDFSVSQFPGVHSERSFGYWLSKSRLFELFLRVYRKLLKRTGKEDPDTSPEWLLGRQILRELAQYAKEKNLPLLLVLAPPVRWITGHPEPLQDSFLNFCTREKLDCIDLTPAFQQAVQTSSAAQYYIPGDYHWTPDGHRLVAEVLFGFLKNYRGAK